MNEPSPYKEVGLSGYISRERDKKDKIDLVGKFNWKEWKASRKKEKAEHCQMPKCREWCWKGFQFCKLHQR